MYKARQAASEVRQEAKAESKVNNSSAGGHRNEMKNKRIKHTQKKRT